MNEAAVLPSHVGVSLKIWVAVSVVVWPAAAAAAAPLSEIGANLVASWM